MTTVAYIIQGAIAFGTIAVAIMAIWGDWIRSVLAPPKLTIRLPLPVEDPTTFSTPSGSRQVMFYHLNVINQRPWLPARNCRVMLMGLTKRGPNGLFQPVTIPVPFQFVWAPAESTPPTITLLRQQFIDLEYIEDGGSAFIPRLYIIPNNFQGFVGTNDAVRFHLQIEAENFASPQYHTVAVAWDGVWSHIPQTMRNHLQVRLI